ncbi:MAG: NAD-dependent epimerase [Microbacteriaceae bacterium]|nr:NAD-dependent epimerase [Microbacteriaceae bacterium]
MKIVIFGANGPTGQLATKQALAEGHTVTAFTRHPEAFPLRDENLRVMQGDVFDPASVDRAVAGQDAVLSTLGVPFGRKKISVYSVGTAHILEAMKDHGVRRLVAVSSSAADPAVRFHDTEGGFFFEKILKPVIIFTLGRTLYADMWRMEELLEASDVDWTVIRPSGLFETTEVTDYRTAEAVINGRFTSRADLADCMLRQLGDDSYLHKAVAVATFSVQPSVLELIRNEALSSPAKG